MNTLDIIKALLVADNPKEEVQVSHWKIGKNYLIRTVTHIQTGRLVDVTEHEFVLEDAAWIADTGRFGPALAESNFAEQEMFPAGRLVLVGRGALIDAVEIDSLPTVQK